jgi:PD-(D/E)XK endonuclease
MAALTPTEKGGIAELAIAYEAARLGIVVSQPMMEGRRYDLIFDVPGELLRVQCKYAHMRNGVISAHLSTCRHTPRGYVKTTYAANEIDAVAVWCPETNRTYLLRHADLVGRHAIYLRVTPARNNQRTGVKMACDYTLGAIAQLGERRHGMAEVEGSSPSSSTKRAA